MKSAAEKRISWIAGLVALAFAAAVIYRSFTLQQVRCEICLTYQGRTACRSVEAADELEGRSTALTTVCAVLASGVTDTLACQRTSPDRFSCERILK